MLNAKSLLWMTCTTWVFKPFQFDRNQLSDNKTGTGVTPGNVCSADQKQRVHNDWRVNKETCASKGLTVLQAKCFDFPFTSPPSQFFVLDNRP